MANTTTATNQTKPRKRATITVKRQYTGNLDIEVAFTEVISRALYKISIPAAITAHAPYEPCLTKTPV